LATKPYDSLLVCLANQQLPERLQPVETAEQLCSCPFDTLNAEMRAAWRAFIAAKAWGSYDGSLFAKRVHAAAWPETIRPYNLRHSVMIDALAAGVPLDDVQGLAGHTSPATTRHHRAPTEGQRPTGGPAQGRLRAAQGGMMVLRRRRDINARMATLRRTVPGSGTGVTGPPIASPKTSKAPNVRSGGMKKPLPLFSSTRPVAPTLLRFQARPASSVPGLATSQYCAPAMRNVREEGVSIVTMQQVPNAGRLAKCQFKSIVPGFPALSSFNVTDAEFVPVADDSAMSICESA
jgi:hypothetical protein